MVLLLVAVAMTTALATPALAAVPASGRAWELVTPAEPVAAGINSVTGVSVRGDRFSYLSKNPMSGAPAGDPDGNNLAQRGAAGWYTQPFGAAYTIPHFESPGGLWVVAMNDDLTSFVYAFRSPLLPTAPPSPRLGIYRHRLGGELTLIADLGPVPGFNPAGFRGASSDLATIVVSTTEHLLPGDAGRTTGESIYESVGSTLRQVDVASDGSLLSECGSSVDKGGVSASGSRIFFANPVACSAPSRVYLRESGSKTVEISASRCNRPDCNEPQAVSFAGATPSGSVAFMTTTQQLTNDDENDRSDLYRFDSASGTLSLVSPGSVDGEGQVATQRVLTSTDGARFYFRAEGRLLPGQGAEAGTNLYLAGKDGLRFVAPIGDDDRLEISADGEAVVLATAMKLEAGDTDQQRDVYRYDASTGQLTRLSAGATGGNGPFDAGIAPKASSIDRAMTADGRRVFFSTTEQLLPDDRNEVLDIYEWAGGALGLVSSGAGEDPAEYATATADGGTVLFRTAASLLPRDRDAGDLDFYAARIGGGFAEPQPTPEACSRCDAPTSLARPAPASTTPRSRRKGGRIRLLRLDKGAGSSIAATGRAVLEVAVPAPGRVSAQARSLFGTSPRIVASGVGGAVHPGRIRLQLVVKPAARRQLRRTGSLKLRLILRQGPRQATTTIYVRLGDSA